MTTTPEGRRELKALAEKATPGEHVALSCPDTPTDCCDYGVVAVSLSRETCRVWNEADARYYAAANPATVLSLLAALEEAEGKNKAKDEAIRAHLFARDALEDTPVQNLRPDDDRFKAVADTLADLRAALTTKSGEASDA
ncbi:ead/Ea22-like family protein [Caulobacter segnis]|nr:ead/Ea22-like family protein [Caulobacter segnis]